jgi:hypothetical protein
MCSITLLLAVMAGCATTEDFSFEGMINDWVETTVGDDDAESGEEDGAASDTADSPPQVAGPAAD